MIFSVVLYYNWEAMLVSYLAARFVSLPFTSIETLISDTNYKIFIEPGTYAQTSFERSINPTWQAAWSERIKPNLEDYTTELYTGNMGIYVLDFQSLILLYLFTIWHRHIEL